MNTHIRAARIVKTLEYGELSHKIIAAAYNVHRELGYGFLDKVYKNALAAELQETGIKCTLEVPIPVLYHGRVVGDCVADMVVEEKIVVEVTAVTKPDSAHEVQLVNCLKATGLRMGLLVNFGESVEVKRRTFGSDAEKGD
jgi:GxxExxY protein